MVQIWSFPSEWPFGPYFSFGFEAFESRMAHFGHMLKLEKLKWNRRIGELENRRL